MKKFFIVLTILFFASLFYGCVAIDNSDRRSRTVNLQNNTSIDGNEIDFNAQYLRTSYSSRLNQAEITVVSSVNELNRYFENRRISEIEKYTDNFFANNFLVIAGLVESSGSNRHEVKSVSETGDIVINRLVPEIGTADMAAWNIIIELNKNINTRQFKVSLVEVEYKYY